MKSIRLCGLLAAFVTPLFAFAQAQSFDEWADGVATEQMRANPVFATFQQYLPAAE